jgi:acetyltransferase-like isoleucine patch superfamily enzyme
MLLQKLLLCFIWKKNMAYTDVNYKFKKIGKNVEIGDNVYFRYPELIEIGNNVIIDDFCYFSSKMVIEDFVHFGPHCSVIGGKDSGLIMRQFSGLSAGVRIICGSNDFLGEGLTNPTVPHKYRPNDVITTVEIEKHAIIGTSVVIHPGVKIGEGVAVGSMSLVTKSLDPWNIYMGQPAKFFKKRDKEKIIRFEELLKKELELNDDFSV